MAFEPTACPKYQKRFGYLRLSVLRPRIGIKCPQCKNVLKPKLLLRFVVFLALCGASFYVLIMILGFDPRAQFADFLWLILAILVADYLSVSFLSFELASASEEIKTDGETEFDELSAEIDAELSELEREERDERARLEPDWSCEACGEVNAYAFEACWKCGREGRRGAI